MVTLCHSFNNPNLLFILYDEISCRQRIGFVVDIFLPELCDLAFYLLYIFTLLITHQRKLSTKGNFSSLMMYDYPGNIISLDTAQLYEAMILATTMLVVSIASNII